MENALHSNELPISLGLVQRLISSQFPQYASLPITPLGATGSTNRLFRLGDDLLIRLPRQPGGGKGIQKERDWLPALRSRLPVEIPKIIELGQPATDYPESWAISRWLDGELPQVWQAGDPGDPARVSLAKDLAAFIRSLQNIEIPPSARADTSLRGYRGRALAEYDSTFRRTVESCRALTDLDLDLDVAETIWSEAMRQPGASEVSEDRWYHSDLVAENLLLRNGELAAVLDFGGLAIGDPTIELHGAWELFDPAARQVFREALGVAEDQWLRGRAWALAIALVALSYYWQTMPERRRDRLAMARSVLADAARS